MNRMRTPGPFWLWLIAAIIFAQVVKRSVGWSLAADFDSGSRFLDNFLANLILGIPIILVYFLALGLLNFGRIHQPADQDAGKTLVNALRADRNPNVRAIAARALADLDDTSASGVDRIAELQSAMKNDTSASVKEAAKAGLEKLMSDK